MVFAIRHRGLESPEVAWRRNLREDALKLEAEVQAWHPYREELDRAQKGFISLRMRRHFEKVAMLGRMRAELPKTFRNGMTLAQAGPISAITNFTTGTTYNKLVDAIYLASSGDEIILPAGCGANNGSFIRYSNFSQLASYPTYTNISSEMIYANPAQASTSATYISIVGIPSQNTLSSVSWASTSGGQLTAVISGSAITTYRKGMFVRVSGATNTGTGGVAPGVSGSINNTFVIFSVSGSTLVLTAPASAGVYGTIGGSPVLNNDRAQISSAIGYLTATLTPGDTTIHLDDATDFLSGGSGLELYAWGNGDGTWQSERIFYTSTTSNTLTGVDSTSLSSPVPVGNPIACIMPGGKALLTPAATNIIGNTISNVELWAAAAFPSGGGIFQWPAQAGESFGSLTLNNMFMHDCMFGIRPGNSSPGTGVFLDMFNCEIWRCGVDGDGANHNMYIEGDRLTLQNCRSWFTKGAYLCKSRARVNYCLGSSTFGAHGSDANLNAAWTSNYDFSNGGEVYLIGSLMSANLHDTGSIVRWGEEVGYQVGGLGGNSSRGAANPKSNIYVSNCNGVGPPDGIGTAQTNVAAISVGFPGLKNPESPFVSTVSGGSLPARSYWFSTTLIDVDGNESLPSYVVFNDAFTQGLQAKTDIGVNTLAVVTSPVARTGAVTYNVYAAHGDPLIWWNSGSDIPPATGPNQFFWDSAFTLPMCVVNSGGSQPAAFVYIGVVYVFSDGTESVNMAVAGSFTLTSTGIFGEWLATASPVSTNAAVISIPVNSLLTIKSPPAASGATGWYPLVNVTSWNAGGSYFAGDLGTAPLSRQVFTPIAIGTDWVQSGPFIRAETMRYSFFKQNASPITLGTNWTEPTTGLVNLNPTNLLKWYRRGNDDDLGFSRWYAEVQSGQAATNYIVNASNSQQDGAPLYPSPIQASIAVFSGATSPSYPFDADYPASSLTISATSATLTTAATNTVGLSSFRNNSTAGSGWTQIAALGFLMSQYKINSSPQTGAAVPQTGGGAANILVDAIAGTSLAIRGSPQSATVASNAFSITIPTIVSGDVLVMDVAMGNNGILRSSILFSVDAAAWGPPAQNQAMAHSPVGLVINNAFAYYNPANCGYNTGGYIQTFPGAYIYAGVGYPTVSSFNIQVNSSNGSGFDAPLIAAVWNDATNFDFSLAGGSPLIGAGTNPGTGDGYSLVPTFQTAMFGQPTPGFPIAALAGRSDSGVTLGAVGSGGPPPPAFGPRLRFRFGWDWKLGAAILAAAVIKNNPSVSRRNMLLLTDETAPPRGKRSRLTTPTSEERTDE